MNEERFGSVLQQFVTRSAPKVFAIVEVFGTQESAEVCAWGMELADGAHVIGEGGALRMHCDSAQDACDILGHTGQMHLVWP